MVRVERESKARKTLEIKNMRIRDFDGDATHWEAWVHSFKSAIRSTCPMVLKAMEEVEKLSTEGTDDKLGEVDGIGKLSGEMYDILSQYCTGEALNTVRG